ncbi:unnamed protein product [Cuscuta epithymum]|uniref:F-box domain-containing protein n=1 Tax=Cuscuta epithymum TaxID=186058 RepID=A0AAV0FCR5_9ASTE|nr:unnamed protein product [Cuscuta epithymum]
MPTSYGHKFGLWSPQHRLVLRLLLLTGLGLGTGTVISSYLRLKKKVMDDDGYTEEDLISAMPSDILCSILSRLDTKDVVRTSILSTRWSNLYLFLPYYSFSCRCSFEIPFRGQCSCTAEYRKEIMTVLDRFFRMPRGAGCEKIKSFCLSLCVKRDFTCHIERWVRQIAGLGVEEFTLRLCCQQSTKHITFPLQKLLCEAAAAPMLKSLHLAACILEPFNPQHPFKSLTSLRLSYIESVDVQSVLLSCPELESLTLEYCCLHSKLFIGGGKQLKLKSLIIYRCHGGVNEISLCAENLVILEVQLWIDSTMKFPHPTNAPKLQHVNITVMHSEDMCDIIRWVGNDCPQVESLYLDLSFGNRACAYSLPREVPTFGHMRQLYILMEFNELFDVTQVAALITGCPLLQRLHLVGRGRKPCYLRIGERVSLRNHHLHLHLKEVEFGGFLGLENEVALVLYILKNALALERMVLCRDYRWYTGASKGGKWEERKDYKGPTWSKNPPYNVTFDQSKLQTIHQQLRGQAASPKAQVIVI